jgi:PII-like signaling protein
MMRSPEQILRMKVYLGEDKKHGHDSLCDAVVGKIRSMNMAGTTVYRGLEGFGRSTRLHTYAVVMSEDLPMVIEIIDREAKIRELQEVLTQVFEIALITIDKVDSAWFPQEMPPGA